MSASVDSKPGFGDWAPDSGVQLTGQALLGSEDRLAIDEVLDDLLLEAAEAREDFDRFCEFVGREENTRQQIKLAAHQRVFTKFVVEHDRCVTMLPVGHAKSFLLALLTLWQIGRNPSLRGAILSATQGQAEKIVKMVRDYIESSDELHLVFPHLRPSRREGDHWTQINLVVDRPPGIRDATLIACGMDGAIMGSRLNWVVVDDMLNAENTRTKEARAKVKSWVDAALRTRLDPDANDVKLVFSNTPWDEDDLVMTKKRQGFATILMDATGDIWVWDDAEDIRAAEENGIEFVPWDSDELRPALETSNEHDPRFGVCRLRAHDPDPDDQVTLWPERIDRKELEKLRRTMEAHAFLQSYMCRCFNADTAWCQPEWIERCKAAAHSEELRKYMPEGKPLLAPIKVYRGPYTVWTGVDLAVSEKAKSDNTAFFSFCVLPTGHRMILDIDEGKYNPTTVKRKLVNCHASYDGFITVEDVGMQKFCLGLLRDAIKGAFAIKGFTTTGQAKRDAENGIPIIMAEIEQGLWLIPNDRHGNVAPAVQRWIDGVLNYQPSSHTADSLMAQLFARTQAKRYNMLGGKQATRESFDVASR